MNWRGYIHDFNMVAVMDTGATLSLKMDRASSHKKSGANGSLSPTKNI
jgi:hypothetical protein